jgi:hypothetical protein
MVELAGFRSRRARVLALIVCAAALVQPCSLAAAVYDSFDNRPATEGSAQNDWGATLSVGLTF